MPMIDNFVSNLLTACTRKGWSQAELARQSGVHYVTVNKIIKRKLNPTVELCEKLASAAGFSTPEKIFRKPD